MLHYIKQFSFFLYAQEYGMLHFQSCKKYQLMPDDVADSYFINYRTGKLHVNLTDEPYDVDNYCVEYKKNDDDNLIEV